MSLLELRRLNKSFGGLTCISDLDLHVDEGEIVSVIGPNGAGKTTLFNVITGVYAPDSGEILLEGESLVGLEPHQVTNRGVARTFQTLRLFLNMSVRENVMAVQYGRTKATPFEAMLRLPRARREEREIRERALKDFDVLEVLILHRYGEIRIGENIVLIVVGAEHRADAFRACKWCIDELKQITPIWKLEKTPEGEVWVEEHP